MTQDKTGGAAFPKLKSSYGNAQGSVDYTSANGMTLLDYFAAKAMPEVLRQMRDEHKGNDGTIAESSYPVAAEYSYKLAAAMIEERKKYTNQ